MQQVNGEKCKTELKKKRIKTAEDSAKWWSGHLEGWRTELYKAAIDGAGETIQVYDGKKYHCLLLHWQILPDIQKI
jgi:hypothetical protein